MKPLVPMLIAAGVLVAGCGHRSETEAAKAAPAAAKPAAAKPVPPPHPPAPPHAEAREATVKSLAKDHSTIRYRVYGGGEPALVFVHCWSCDSGYWDSQLDTFAQHYTVVTLDLAGHGKSDVKKRKQWTIANYAKDVAAVVEAVGSQRVILVGHSMGGAVTLEAARLLKHQVIGIVGVDTFREIVAPPPKETLDKLRADMVADFPKATREFIGNNMFSAKADPIVKKWVVEDMASAPPKVAIPSLDSLVAEDYKAALADLDLPIVAINADPPATDEAAIRKLAPRFRLVTMPGYGHFLMMEDRNAFNALLGRVVEAWAKLPAPATPPLSKPASSG